MSPIRFLLACIALICGAFVFLPAPSVLLCQLKLGVTEFGNWFLLLSVLVIVMGRRTNRLDSAAVTMAVIAALLFISTPIRASMFATEAKRKMKAAFPEATQAAAGEPFSFGRIWSFGGPPVSQPQTMKYAEVEGTELNLDLYLAEDRKPAPCIIVLHMGGWDAGERREPDFVPLVHHLSSRGYAVALIDYRLAPNFPWPAQWEDTVAAMRYLTERAEDFGIDPKKFVLMGRSAGGQIAETVAAPGSQPGVVGCIGLYAPADLNFAYKYADKKDILNSEKLLRQYLGGTPTEVPDNYGSASAYGLVNEKTPPTLLIHGANDDMVWVKQSERYAEQLKATGVKHVFLKPPWGTHALDYGWNTPGGQLTTWAVEQFLAAVTQ